MPRPDTRQQTIASPTSVSSLWSASPTTERQDGDFPAAPPNSPRSSDAGDLARSLINESSSPNAITTAVMRIANALDISDSVEAERLTQQLGSLVVNTPTPTSLTLLETIHEIVTPSHHTPTP